jgi:hypothetical protein
MTLPRHRRRVLSASALSALANFLDGFFDEAAGETAVSAYLDTRKMLAHDFLAEAAAIIERVRQRESAVAEYC